MLFIAILIISDLILVGLVAVFFNSLNTYFDVEKAGSVVVIYIIMYLINIFNSFINNIVLGIIGIILAVLFLVYLCKMLDEFRYRLDQHYNHMLKELDELSKYLLRETREKLMNHQDPIS